MKRTISIALLASVIGTNIAPTLNVFADEVLQEKAKIIEEAVVNAAKITAFKLNGYTNFEEYNNTYKILSDEIQSISNNGGQYGSSSIKNAIDGNLSTHWETGTANSSSFNNEVVVEFKDVEAINRIAYATRQDGAKGKGYPTKFEVYASATGSDENYKLVSEGSSSATGNMMEFKFDTVTAKKIKFVFKEANQSWASASEFYFYREDKIIDKFNQIFTDSTMSEVTENFNTIEKINQFKSEAETHPLYEDFKADLDNALALLEQGNVIATTAKVSKFNPFYTSYIENYDKVFRVGNDKIASISNNGGNYGSSVIKNAIDNDVNTHWETGKANSSSFKNEVILTLKNAEEFNRVVYKARAGAKGFANEFSIYVSSTDKGDNFQKVSSGTASTTNDLTELKFSTVKAKRVKFVFDKANQDWASIADLRLYKEDNVAEKMATLFTDNTLSAVSEEFNTVEKINALAEEVKNHPLYEEYKENIEIAKILVNQEKVEASKAQVVAFDIKGDLLTSYDKVYKINNENITISNNGGNYGSAKIQNAIDGNFNTYWETGKGNSNDFENEVNFTFKEAETINRIVYAARQDGAKGKGFANEFEVYVSQTDKGDNFQLLTTGSSNLNNEVVEIKLQETNVKRLKFVYKKANQAMASAAEFGFYKEDNLSDVINDIFTDGTMTNLKDEYNNIETINELAEKVANHPLKSRFEIIINAAKEALDENTNNAEKVITLSQRGNTGTEKERTQTWSALFAFDPTGYYVKPGETIKVYVEADENGKMPQLFFGQIGRNQGSWYRYYTLKPGYNEITAPKDMSLAAVYFAANALPNEQAYAPTVRLDGGTKFPIYQHGKTDPKEFVAELREYLKEVNYNDDEVIAGNGKYNICEITSENVIISTSAAGALVGAEADLKQGKDTSYMMDLWEDFYKDFAELSGFETEDETDLDYMQRGQFIIRVFTGGPFAWAGWGYTGYNGGDSLRRDGSFYSSLASSGCLTNGGWTVPHEVGHLYDNGSIGTAESTNNLYSLMLQDKYLKNNRMVQENRWEKHFTHYHNTKEYPNDLLFHGAIVYQLYPQFGDKVYGQASKVARQRRSELTGLNNKQRLAVALSLATGYDLLYHFEYYGIEMNDKARSLVEGLKEYDKKTYYNNNKSINEEAKAFVNKEAKAKVEITNTTDTTIDLKMSIDENDDTVLLYEVYRDGKYLGVTYGKTFTDKTVEKGVTYEYSVIAYDRQLNTSVESDTVVKNLNEPTLSVDKNVTLKLKEKFDLASCVKALDYEGNDITSAVKVVEGEVNTNKVGSYKLLLEVTHEGLTTREETTINVVSDYTYLSDMQEVSAKVGWGQLRKDKAINNTTITLLKNNQDVTYKKGLGAHANSEIVYNVENMGYDYFESKIGVDQAMRNTKASVTFEVYVDGVKQYNSKVFKHNTNQESIRVNIAGAKEVKLVTTDANDNGNSSDHSVWAEARFTTSNSKPSLQIPQSLSTKVGEELELNESYSANDVEDGDLTEQVVVKGIDKIDYNQAGKYPITYSVEDSDGNVVEKTRYVHVVNMENFTYLTDNNWKSASQSYSTLKKDVATSGNKLRLTAENGEVVTYERGLGAHSTSTVVYDLTNLDKEYSRFSSFVGVDRAMYGSVGSVQFQVYVDGKVKFDSGIMNSRDAQKYLDVDITGAKELKLVVKDGGNGNGSDHATWGNTKLH